MTGDASRILSFSKKWTEAGRKRRRSCCFLFVPGPGPGPGRGPDPSPVLGPTLRPASCHHYCRIVLFLFFFPNQLALKKSKNTLDHRRLNRWLNRWGGGRSLWHQRLSCRRWFCFSEKKQNKNKFLKNLKKINHDIFYNWHLVMGQI